MSFFDRMKDSISVAGAEVSQKVSQTSDTMKWNNQIKNNEKKIEKIIYQVGALCVKKHLAETETEYEGLFSQIRRYQAENQDLQEKIRLLNEECERQTQIRQQEMKERQEQRERERQERELAKQAAQQAAQQAAEQAAQQAQSQTDLKTCPNCGKNNNVNSRFCIYCGTPLE